MVPVMSCLQLVTRIGEVNGKVSAHLPAILPSSLVFSRHLSVVIFLCDLQDSLNALLVLGRIDALLVVSNYSILAVSENC